MLVLALSSKPHVKFNQHERRFPEIMAEKGPIFDEKACISRGPDEFPSSDNEVHDSIRIYS